ncbi:putative ribonuclease H protein [Glycine max]|nr:putative ribonuclease H protein [Glycine max]
MVEYSKVLVAEQYRVGSETYYAPCLGSFFISKPTLDNVSAIKAILRSFELVSGLRINFAKSQFGAIGQSEEWCTLAADILNCGPLQFPFIYLIRKFEAKLNKWNQRSLSMAGRITLINVVLTALPLFYMSFFRAPTAIVKRLTAIQRQYLWGGNLEGKKIAWVAWNQVCAPKEKGGLGVKDIKAFNRALLIKWKWLMFQQQDHLWSRILTSKYRGWRGLEEGPPKQIFSSWWSDLRFVTQHNSMAAVNKHFRWNLGSGDQILFWEDSWVGEGIALKDKYPNLYQVTSQKLKTVASMGIFGEHGWEWQFSWRRCLFDSELGGVSAFIDQTVVINTNAALRDSWVWGAEPNGIFSTNSAYNCIKADQLPSQPITGFRQLWEIKIPPTALAFAWRLLWDRLPSKENLIRRKLELCTAILWRTFFSTAPWLPRGTPIEGGRGESEDGTFSLLWRLKIPPKAKVFTWRLIKDRLPTNMNLRGRQVEIADPLCPFYNNLDEDAAHLFFNCSKAIPWWWETVSWVKSVGAFPKEPKDHFMHHSRSNAYTNKAFCITRG